MENLGLNSKFLSREPLSNESVTDIIKKFQNHPSIIKIKEKTIKGILVLQLFIGN